MMQMENKPVPKAKGSSEWPMVILVVLIAVLAANLIC